MKIIKTIGITWLILAFLFWLLVNLATNPQTGESNFSFTIFYYLIWIFVVGGLFWKYNIQISNWLQSIKLPNFWKVAIIGFLTIVSEELIAGFTNAINDSWALPHIFLRIQQFELFNWFTFAGFIIGWAILLGRIEYTRKELFIIAGLWGFMAEHQWYLAFANPLVFLSLGTLTFMTYGVIMTPMMLSVKPSGKKLNPLFRWLLAWLIPFVLSIIPIIILQKLIESYPTLFPPANLVT